MNSWYILHTWPTGGPGGVTLTVNADGGALLTVCDAPEMAGLPEKVELGDYRAALEDGEANTLRELVHRAIAGAKPAGALRPGTRVRRLELGTLGRGADEQAAFAPGVEQPPVVAECDSALTAFASTLLEHPYAVVRGSAACAAPQRDLPLDVTVELESAGSVPVTFAHPLAGDAAELPVRLTIHPDVPLEKRTSDDTVFLTLARAEADAGKGGARGAEATLAPGEKLVLRLRPRRHLHLSPGAYVVSVSIDFAAPGGDPARDVAQGTLILPAGTIALGSGR